MAEIKISKAGKEYIKYSDREIIDAKETSVIDFLGRKYGYSFKRIGRYYQCREHDSLIIQDNEKSWFWNSQDLRGRNVFDWLQRVEHYTYAESLRELIGVPTKTGMKKKTYSKAPELSSLPLDEVKEIKLPEKTTDNYKRVFAYLIKERCIDPDIVGYLVQNHLLYQDTYGNAVFTGFDENNEIKFAERKTTCTFLHDAVDEDGKKIYRPRNVSGSDKRYSFNVSCDKKYGNRCMVLYVFEAPVDLLSHATFRLLCAREKAQQTGTAFDSDCWRDVNRLSLSGVSSVALESYLNRNPQITKLVFCLDNDDVGIKASAKLVDEYSKKGYSCTRIKPFDNSKDYNEFLQKYCKQKEYEIGLQNNQSTAIPSVNTVSIVGYTKQR